MARTSTRAPADRRARRGKRSQRETRRPAPAWGRVARLTFGCQEVEHDAHIALVSSREASDVVHRVIARLVSSVLGQLRQRRKLRMRKLRVSDEELMPVPAPAQKVWAGEGLNWGCTARVRVGWGQGAVRRWGGRGTPPRMPNTRGVSFLHDLKIQIIHVF